MTKQKNILLVLFAIIIALFSCACASAPEPDILSEAEIEALREEYPLEDYSSTFSPSVSFNAMMTISNAIAIIEVTDDWYTRAETISPVGDLDAPFPGSLTCPYLPVKIETLLYSDGVLEEGDEISLYFGSTTFFGSFDTYGVGERFLCFIGCGKGAAYYDDTVYSCSNMMSAYITEDEYILSVDSKGPFKEFTGYSLDSYCEGLPKQIKAAKKAIKGKTPIEVLYSEE